MDDIKLRELIYTITKAPLFPNECKRTYMKNDDLKINQVFCFKIIDNVYVYGSVLNSSLTNCWSTWYDGAIVIEIYDFFTKDINMEEFIKCNKNIFLGPIITKLSFFKKGILIPLECYYDSNTSYGFFKEELNTKNKVFQKTNKVYDEYGKVTKRNKEYISSYSITTNVGLFQELFSKIVKRKNLLISNKNEFESFKRFILSKEEV